MLVSDITYSNIKTLSVQNTVAEIKKLMLIHTVNHLPVLINGNKISIISQAIIDRLNEDDKIQESISDLLHVQVYNNDHILTALKIASIHNLSLLPVSNENNEYEGCISRSSLLNALYSYLDMEKSGGIIVLEMQKHNYSFGELCRLIETNDAYITQLSSFIHSTTGLLQVTIKINKTEISDIIATLQRYDYTVKHYFGEENYENELKENYENLLSYLNI